jgi:hypothetical protein
MPLCFVDCEGNRFTTARTSEKGDWWVDARILDFRDFERMYREGQLPVLEVNPYTGELL